MSNEPRLCDRGDGVRGHFCIGRLRVDPRGDYMEYWHTDRWCSAGQVFIGESAAKKGLARARQGCKPGKHVWAPYFGPGRKYAWRVICKKCGGKARG